MPLKGTPTCRLCTEPYRGGDMGVYGVAVMSFFSSGILVILILMCGITVSSSPTVCGFSSFWLTAFGKRRSFTVLQYGINVVENSYCTYIRQERPNERSIFGRL